ncbi:hypothetical protein ABL78_1378 [Leptomonas seymouri]|uniref:Uncharacterized protein n=1 Tax=Leptomonas seymouri TaxID=5684 RepID=A0A0N1I907_LEPSE|nr:hypothetical protein ABL78_1378 [Leptomonas seymouri]|eukprot:KPI89502.1 hypothetical protein ABL78_1378 [Leptomonas seymouri]
MATLKDGRFVFIHAEREYLFIEHPSTVSGDAAAKDSTVAPLATQLLYGGVVYAFGLNTAQTRIVMVCPTASAAASATPSTGRLNATQAVLRLFSFSNGEVGELLCELITVMSRRVTWVGDRYIALDLPADSHSHNRNTLLTASTAAAPTSSKATGGTSSTMLVEVLKSPTRLKVLRVDESVAYPTAGPGSILCGVCITKQVLRVWDLQRSKLTSECQLPNRKCRHGKTRTAVATGSVGPLVFVVNDDWTVHAFHVGRNGTLHTPKPVLTQFESQSVSRARQGSISAGMDKDVDSALHEGADQREGHGDGAEGPERPPRPSSAPTFALPTPQLLACALSEAQVLLALTGSSTILQIAHDPKGKDDELKVVAKMRLPRRFHATAEVVGLSKKKCLVRQREPLEMAAHDEVAGRTCGYFVLPLEMKPAGKGSAMDVVAEESAEESNEAAARGNTERGVMDRNDSTAETGPAGETFTAVVPTDGKRKRKKSKKAAAVSDAEDSAAAAPASSTAGSGVPAAAAALPPAGQSCTGGPTQRAVQRLLLQVGLSPHDRMPNAIVREGRIGGFRSEGGALTAATETASGDLSDPLPAKQNWLPTDVVYTAGGVVVGAVMMFCVMRRLSLL